MFLSVEKKKRRKKIEVSVCCMQCNSKIHQRDNKRTTTTNERELSLKEKKK